MSMIDRLKFTIKDLAESGIDISHLTLEIILEAHVGIKYPEALAFTLGPDWDWLLASDVT
jgi:hypothetical protein